ncbi:MAG: hypothetical protein GWP19_00775 [Planctomycetia bacterium]|nr:hypothetical protein [Planctomycetia bacterium]
MKTTEIKKEVVATLKTELDITASVKDSIASILQEYIDFVEENIPHEFWKIFGIGKAGGHRQFGNVYGFEASSEYRDDYYTIPGNGYYIANDWDAKVEGSNFYQMKEFASRIKDLVEEGLDYLSEQNKSTSEIIENLKDLF